MTSFLPLLSGFGNQREACLSFSPFQMSLLGQTVLTLPSAFNAHFAIHGAPHAFVPPPLRLPNLVKKQYSVSGEAQVTTAVGVIRLKLLKS